MSKRAIRHLACRWCIVSAVPHHVDGIAVRLDRAFGANAALKTAAT